MSCVETELMQEAERYVQIISIKQELVAIFKTSNLSSGKLKKKELSLLYGYKIEQTRKRTLS